MSNYTLNRKETEDFLNSRGDPHKYKLVGHQPIPLKGVGKMYCKSCGLVFLRNKATQWCVAKGCEYSKHSQYSKAMDRLS